MADTDSPLSTTASIIAIVTLVYAIAITVQIYAKAIYQAQRETEALARRIGHGEHGIKEMCSILEDFGISLGDIDLDAGSGSYGESELRHALSSKRRYWPAHMHDHIDEDTKRELGMLADKMNAAYKKWSHCAREWELFKTDLEKTQWGVFGSASYAPILTPMEVLILWPTLIERRAIPWIAVRTMVTMLLWLVAFTLGVGLGLLWLTLAISYDIFVLVYNALVWLDIKHLMQRLRWAAKQGDIAQRMQEVESTIADLRMQVLLRSYQRSQERVQRMLVSVHDHIDILMSVVVDPEKARAALYDMRKISNQNIVGL